MHNTVWPSVSLEPCGPLCIPHASIRGEQCRRAPELAFWISARMKLCMQGMVVVADDGPPFNAVLQPLMGVDVIGCINGHAAPSHAQPGCCLGSGLNPATAALSVGMPQASGRGSCQLFQTATFRSRTWIVSAVSTIISTAKGRTKNGFLTQRPRTLERYCGQGAYLTRSVDGFRRLLFPGSYLTCRYCGLSAPPRSCFIWHGRHIGKSTN